MHAAIAHKTDQVKPLAPCLREGLHEDGILRELPFADRLIDPCQVLVDDPTRAQVQVSYFTVAHLAFWQAHILPAATDLCPWILGVEMIVKRRSREQRGVTAGHGASSSAGIDAPAIA